MIEPWSKFFWADYDSDEGLRMCSLAAQGLWMRMLCLMARATPKGEMRVGGKPCSIQDLAKSVSESDVTVQHLLNELEDRGVYSVTRVGVIFCRRMRKDAEISRKRAEAGRKGGITSVGNKKEYGICPSKTQANDQAKVKPQKPEAIFQKERDNLPAQLPEPPGLAAPSPSEEFDRVQAECSRALGDVQIADFVIGPMVELVRKYGQERVLFQLASESRRPRQKPIKTWKLWAQIVSENLVAAHGLDPPKSQNSGRKIDIDSGHPMPEENLRRAVVAWRADPKTWVSQWGDPPDMNRKIQAWLAETGETTGSEKLEVAE